MFEKKKFTKKMPFAPVKRLRRNEEEELAGRHLTERQLAARKRQRAQAQAARAAGVMPSRVRTAKLREGEVRVTNMIASELTRAFAVILKLDGPADVLMRAFFKSNPRLGERDRSILAEAIYCGLRQFAGISWRMKPMIPSRAPRVAALLTLALRYGRESMNDAVLGPDKAVVEKLLAMNMNRAPGPVQAEMPQWLYERVENQYGHEEAAKIFAASNSSAPLDIRVNLMKGKRDEVLADLKARGLDCEAMRFSPDGIRLKDKPALTRWSIYRDGVIDVQDEGSQLIARLVAPRRGEMVCDFCAGAGGKTLALGALMRSTGRLYAFDINAKRLAELTPRMRRAGLSNVHPIAIRNEHDLRVKRLKAKFDRVLVDAPCTGTGTLRRNPDLKWRLSVDELERINAVQKSVLESASALVKKGGRLVYATCSLLQQENQLVVKDFLARHPEFVLLNATDILAKQDIALPDWQKERFGDFYAMLPSMHDTDGFFTAVMERQD